MAKKQKSGLYRTKIKIGVDADGKDVLKYISAKTKRELEQRRQEVIDYYICGTGLAADRLFGEYAVEWYRVRKAPTVSPASRESYRTALNKEILPIFGDRNLRAIRPIELQEFMYNFAGCSQTKITIIYATLRGIFSSACQDRILQISPAAYLKKPSAKSAAEKRALTEDERSALELTCKADPNGAYLAVMYYLGVRPGEARGLQWGDFDWSASVVHIQRDIDYKAGASIGALKTVKSRRYIPIPDPLREILYPLRNSADAFLFCGEISSAPLAKTTAERIWVELMLAAGMVAPVADGENNYRKCDIRSRVKPIITPHTLRHNYITLCWESGIDPYTTMKLVGHTSIKTTMDIYTHLSELQMEKAKHQVKEMFTRKSCTKVAQAEIEIVEVKNKNPREQRIPKGFAGDPSGIRTPDTLIKSQVLYRLS